MPKIANAATLKPGFVASKPIVVLGLCLGMALGAACSFDAKNLRRPTPADASGLPPTSDADGRGDAGRQPDLGGDTDPGKKADLATLDTGDALVVIGDAREPDTAIAVGVADAQVDLGSAQDDVPAFDPNDASSNLDTNGTSADTNQATDAPVDRSMMVEVGADTLDTGIVGADVGAEAGVVEIDAQIVDAPEADALVPDAPVDVAPPIDPDLVLWYQFEESSGTVAYDSAQVGGVARNATLTSYLGGSATFSATTKQVGARALSLVPIASGGGYVSVPPFNDLTPDAVTIAVWVNLAVAGPAQNWERIYDFGDSSTAPCWFNLSARSGTAPNVPVFNMSNVGHATSEQQKLTGTTVFKANTWYHVAVVLPAGTPYTGVMYVDGEVAATNNAMTAKMCESHNNTFGKSQFSNDPYFNGALDDFRVYRRALTQEEIRALAGR
jgi:hypothetical protein